MFLKKKPLNFSPNADLKLIRLVRDNPVLYVYDIKHEKYKDLNSKEVAWQKIGDELKRTAADCKMRWINIREVHRRLIRRAIKNPGKKFPPYKYQNALQFMRPYYRDLVYIPDNETENIDDCGEYTVYEETNDESDFESENEDDESINSLVKKEIKLKKRKRTVSTDEVFETENDSTVLDFSDSIDTFLKTIGATLKTFSPYRLNLAKTQIFSIVQEHDLQQIMQNQTGVSDDGEAS